MKTIEETRMPLGDHLAELRTRLLRVIAAVMVLSALALVFAKAIYGFLMRPVLLALPSGSSALIYTSAIEEINVYLKVGLYAGLCLTMPLILWESWGFVAPGLHKHERRMAGPFVMAGTCAFFAGTAFCYLALLPPMFHFLLRDPQAITLSQRLEQAELVESVALEALRAGNEEQANALAAQAAATLASADGGDIVDMAAGSMRPTNLAGEELARLRGLGRLCDALAPQLGGELAQAQADARDHRLAAIAARERGDLATARAESDACVAALARALGEKATVVEGMWQLEQRLAAASASRESLQWTRPMLSMSEQLTLVVVLELSTGAVFELPLVMMLLGMVGLVEARWLLRYQRHAFVICVILAAVITPTGDPVNLALMAGPLLACYEIGVLLVWIVERRRARQDAAITT
jgi:sec-independent protein translocase protein TatC